ncbi:hypothetical protein [Candidatus Nitrosocosmicus arcticus]|uniref:Uncharacterized protein n=1 Tax=Candidatus Nitrosocosmicus arcticus TaxID=2035267 RepID=A0A557SY34_9ARCH|nr:hypothetical protein [Candidatus Nitrosocosmicus arcticus]TVP41517.1 hypothetical protein NARC_30232 [Candidatus Nitrosocosmicus arcticus]
MSSEKIYSFNTLQNHSNFDIKLNKSKFIILLLPVLLVSAPLAFNIGTVNAQLNLDDFMKQTQDNIQSTIESSDNNNNNNNCDNNISVQSQTNENGKTTSTTKNTCDDGTTTTTSTNNVNSGSVKANLNGTIVGSEYNQDSGVIINSLFGNWSLTTKDNGSKDFNASFIKQPVYYNLSASIGSGNDTTTNNNNNINTPLTDSNNNIGNTTSYHMSNFVVNSVQQQNEDVTYSGKIDVIKEIKSNNASISDETNNFKGVGVSVSVIDNKVLFINFDSQTPLSKEFVNIPIVGLVKQ